MFIAEVWLPHLGQQLRAEREHGNTDDHFANAFSIAKYVREHSDTTADDGKPVVGYCLLFLHRCFLHFFSDPFNLHSNKQFIYKHLNKVKPVHSLSA